MRHPERAGGLLEAGVERIERVPFEQAISRAGRYDFVARYGGDEFAIVAVDAHEERATEIGQRAIARLGPALDEVLGRRRLARATLDGHELVATLPPGTAIDGDVAGLHVAPANLHVFRNELRVAAA